VPGVNVKTAARSGPASEAAPKEARYFVAGLTERGSTVAPIRVRSAAELELVIGGRVTYGAVYDDARTYLEEGGSEVYISRVVGPDATVGTLSLLDRATSAAPALAIDAASVGAWSSRLSVQVQDGSNTNTFRVRVYLDGALVETFDNLGSAQQAVETLAARSEFIRARNLGSVAVFPTNLPAVAGPTALSAGTDDRAAVTATLVGNALARFTSDLGPGAVACPGYTSAQVGVALRDHAKATRRIALTATASGATIQEATAAADALSSADGGEHVGLFYPWISVPSGTGTTKLISPEGYVAACRNRAHREAGPWRAPAGEIATASYVLGVERELTRSEGDQLDEERVSAIRTIAGSTRLYGWRSLSTDEANYALLTGRDMLNLLAGEAEARLEQYVFSTIDGRGHLFRDIEAELVGLLDPLRALGGLYERLAEDGTELDPGYSVDVGPAVNTPTVLQRNEVRANVAARVSPVGQLITVTIVKSALGANV
jgi:hypothetical protein